ncbi:MAG: YdcF family protein [Kiritimatiellae bacterium]|nr:YdcF family protein [Kiritimatiellia bacterium]
MFYVNRFVALMTSPAVVAAILLAAAFAALLTRRRRAGAALLVAGVAWSWFWASPFTYRWLASGLEMEFPVVTAEESPPADAIAVLGGGMGCNTNEYPYGEMWSSADRVWHAARLYRAGKAPKLFVTGREPFPTVQLLTDLGVPAGAIDCLGEARNTEEECGRIKERLEQTAAPGARPRLLLVTSAWHMRRAKLMFEKYAPGVEMIPAATDYEALVRCGWRRGLGFRDFLPNAEMLFQSSYMIKEIIGYHGYRWLR